MKRDLLRIIYISIISGIIVTVGVYLLIKPAVISGFDLTEKDKLATAIGGLTAPIIGLISTILLYLALSKQTESNSEQRLKNETDMIFLLINQLDTEINSFTFTLIRTRNEIKTKEIEMGFVGIHMYCQSCGDKNSGWGYALSSGGRRFDQIFETMQLMLILESYLIIEKRIQMANLKSDTKELLTSKLKLFYDLKLKDGLIILVRSFYRYKIDQQEVPKKIIDFVDNR